MYEDNRRIGKIVQGFVVLRTEIDFAFERFMRHYIGWMSYEETRAYSAPLSWFVGNESAKMQNYYFHPNNLSDNRVTQFDFLYEVVKFSLENELETVRNAINNKPKAESCWRGKNVVCAMVKSISEKIDEIFRVDARDSKQDYENIANSVEQLARLIEGNYGRKCVNEDSRENMKTCVWESVS